MNLYKALGGRMETLSFASIIQRGVAISRKHVREILTIAFFACLPSFFVAYSVYSGQTTETTNILVILFALLSVVFAVLMQGAITYIVYRSLRGEAVTIEDAIVCGYRQLFVLLGISLLFGIGVYLGLLAFVIPGIILICIWLVVIPAAVVEKKGVIPSFKRSIELTKGYRWTILGLVILFWVIEAILEGMPEALLKGSTSAVLDMSVLFLYTLLMAMVEGLYAACIVVLYFDLRSLKDKISISKLTSVFE